MWPGDLAPNHSNLCASDFLGPTVYKGNLLALVEAICSDSDRAFHQRGCYFLPSSCGVIDALCKDLLVRDI